MLLPTTPFHAQLGTNYTPLDAEITTINRILFKVDAMAAELERQIKALKAKQAACSAFTAAHRALISPIRRVPADILTTIFLLCMESYKKSKMVASESPLLFTRVCHQWRELAIGTASLWTNISIRISSYPLFYSAHVPLMHGTTEEQQELLDVEDEGEAGAALELVRDRWKRQIVRRTELVRFWLERGRECPLSVSVTIRDKVSCPPGAKAVSDLLSLICKHASRWMHFDLFCFNPIHNDLLSLVASQLTRLRSFSMKWQDHANRELTSAIPPDAFTNALTSQHLWLHYPGVISSTLTIQWGKLTELALVEPSSYGARGSTPSVVLAILNSCPALLRCEVNLGDEYGEPLETTMPPYRVLLPHLRRLAVFDTGRCPLKTRAFFDSLDLPSIRSITSPRYSTVDAGRSTELPTISLLRRWGTSLRNADFGYSKIHNMAHLIQAL
ncbi:hypothetical protein BKA70DRAFT_1532363 [Coprinopsis sp. MPI-PUGE-AT-0042]|nr:hypothetical protein BKA70DRAFT_1532363 [Coprinopsis sp. MPI-PUGE-AT-0042]